VAKTIRSSPLLAGVVVALVAVGVGATLLVTGCGSDDSASLPDGVVARVGDANITQAQLDRAIAQSRAEAKAQGQTLPAEGSEGFDQVRQQALQGLVQMRIVDAEARKCGPPCEVTDEEINQELARIRANNFNDSQKEFDEFLEERGISKADARRIVKNQLQQSELFARVTRGVRFSDADAKEYYEENPGQFRKDAGRIARHILVETKAEADRIRAQATPQNFAALAREHSTDTGSASQGGNLGEIQRGQLVPEFEKVAFSLKHGQISQPVKTQFGWHIIMVSVTAAQTTSFTDAKAGIMSSQLAQRRQDAFTSWSEKVLKEWEDRTVYADDSLKPPEPGAATTP
jgi:parvulin-like peptidyl-prolyl isomerase